MHKNDLTLTKLTIAHFIGGGVSSWYFNSYTK